MKPFVQWLKEDGFIVKDTWKGGKWVGVGRMVLFPILEKVFAHILTPDADGRLPYVTIILSAPKKSGKSTWGAAIMAWALENYPAGTELYSLASDLEQAEGIVFADVAFHLNEKYGIQPVKHRLTMENGSFLQALAHHYQSAAGMRHTITSWDELWSFATEKSRRLWAEMTPIPTVNNPLRIIVTYAGFENDDSPLRSMYDRVVEDGDVVPELEDIVTEDGEQVCFYDQESRTFAFWHTDPIMPWQTDEYRKEQQASLRPEEFIRLHENRWVSSATLFCPPEWWDRSAKYLPGPVEIMKDHPALNRPIVFAADAGLKSDCTAVVGCYYDPENAIIGLASHRIWRPRDGQILDLEETLEAYLVAMALQYNILEVVYDPSQLQRSMMTLRKKGILTYEIPQTMSHMEKFTMAFYDLLKHDRFWAYKDDELKSHVLHAQVKPRESTGTFYFRSNVRQKHRYPMDGAVAMAMAAYRALTLGPTIPVGEIKIEMPFSDPLVRDEWMLDKIKKLPDPLRRKEFDNIYEW